MKKCPNPECNKLYSEDDFDCCPKCGTDLVSCEHSHLANDNCVVGNHANENMASGTESTKVNMGSDNVIGGGIHVTDDHTNNESNTNSKNQVHTNSHNTTNNTTIYEAVKSRSELLKEDEQRFRSECKKLFVNGLISREGELQLSELLITLDLPDATAKTIKEQARQQSIKRIQPTAQVISGIRQTKSIIELNNGASPLRQLKQLESWMREYDDDTLKLMYYQMSAILEPAQFTGRYEKSAKNEYWEAYWAYIAYLKQAQDKQSSDARALSGKLGVFASQPESNDVILHLAGRLMQNDPIDDIAKERNTLTANYTSELKPLLDAIDELLQKNWERETIEIRPSHAFYINLFTNFVETQKKEGEKRRRIKDEISRAEREKQEEIKRQKDYLLQKYQEVEDIRQACNDLRIPYLSFRTWLEEDLAFNSSYYEISRRIDEIRDRKAKIEAETQRQKSDFKNRYEQNNCDLLKTCSESGVDSNTVGEWRKLDKAFDDALATIERDNERKQQKTFAKLYVSNNCDLQKTCADMGLGIDIIGNWRKYNKAFDNELCSLKQEYEHVLQGAFVKCYESLGCDIRKACDELGIKPDTINEWRRSNKVFDDELNALKKEHERMMQNAFVECYKSNNCDLGKSCANMHISPDEVSVWRSSYKQFDDALNCLERARAIQRFKKALPYILIVCLLIAACYAFYLHCCSAPYRHDADKYEKDYYEWKINN